MSFDEGQIGLNAVQEHLNRDHYVLDVGSDKPLSYFPLAPESNPALGRRGIRLLLAHPGILHTQLRAILRLSGTHPVAILLPMVVGMDELDAAKEAIERAKAELAAEGKSFDPSISVGAMIETPSAAILIEQLAEEVDFFSVGTYDLVQYLLVADRLSGEMDSAYEPLHPAVLQLDVDPVTNAEFLEFVRDNPKWRRSKVKRIFADQNYLQHWAGDVDIGLEAGKIAGSPVTNVSWFAARAYLKSKGKRLPATDEWEYAACADEARANATDDDNFTQRLLEWYGMPTPKILPAVHDAPANFFGVRAMHGFVWEWIRDFNNAMVTGESRGDSGLDRKLYCAGGALGATDTRNYAAFMRYAFRSSLKGNYTVRNLGFRGARNAEPTRK